MKYSTIFKNLPNKKREIIPGYEHNVTVPGNLMEPMVDVTTTDWPKRVLIQPVQDWLQEQNIKWKISHDYVAVQSTYGPAISRRTILNFTKESDVTLFLLRWL